MLTLPQPIFGFSGLSPFAERGRRSCVGGVYAKVAAVGNGTGDQGSLSMVSAPLLKESATRAWASAVGWKAPYTAD